MKRKIGRGKPLEELVKGSLDYTMNRIRDAFYAQFRADYEMPGQKYFYISEIFGDHVIVNEEGLAPDEYFLVPYRKVGDAYEFAARSEWELVELTYQPATSGAGAGPAANETNERTLAGGEGSAQEERSPVGSGAAPVVEALGNGARGKGRKIVERNAPAVELLEAVAGQPRRIRVAKAMTAGVVNGNGRRYPAAVLRAAAEEMGAHLHESAGQGRLMGLLGEVEHPSDKGGRPNLLETVVKWDEITFDGTDVGLLGRILETSKGRDILALMEGGVNPGISSRGRGESKLITENGQQIEEVTELHWNGFDLVMEPGFQDAAAVLESQREEGKMELEELLKLIREHPELFKGIVADEVKAMTESQRKGLEEQIRAALGIGENEDLAKTLTEAARAKRDLEQQRQREAIEGAIAEATKDLPYGDLNKSFVEAVRAAAPATAEAVKPLVEGKRKEYDAIMAQAQLAGMGFRNVKVAGPVLERETGTPEFARGGWEFTEALAKRSMIRRWDVRQPKTVNEEFAVRVLERFDECYRSQLARESRMLQEAEATTDLSLPYSVSRAVAAAMWPQLVATSVFDFGTIDTSPTLLYYETYAAESGLHVAITDEGITADHGAWVSLAHKMLEPGTVVVTDHSGVTTYTEGTDYVVDYVNGAIMSLAAGTISEGDVHVDYHYDEFREGENAEIERAKMQLASDTITAAADRLATQITSEAIVFSRSQIGWDAVSRTLSGLIQELRRKIDKLLMYNALSAALSVATNTGGTWTAASDPIVDFVGYCGVARVKIAKRYYEPTSILMSTTNADLIANWDGFTNAGSRTDATLNANGYLGRLKGLPVFHSTEMSDGYAVVLNREVVMHRIFQPMILKGPYPTYSNGKLVAADQWFAEEYNATAMPVPGKASYVKIA